MGHIKQFTYNSSCTFNMKKIKITQLDLIYCKADFKYLEESSTKNNEMNSDYHMN